MPRRCLARLAMLAVMIAPCAATAQQSYSPPWTPSVVGTGQAGLQGFPLFLWNGFGSSTFDARPTLRVDRDVETDPSASAGVQWNTYKTIWSLTATGYNSPGFEWSLVGEIHNRTRKSAGAQNVAVNGTMWKDKTDNGEETGTSWAGNFNCVDSTGFPDPTTSCIGVEVDLGGGIGTDVNRQRVGVHIAAGGQPGAHVGYALLVSPSDQVTIDRAIAFHPGGGRYGIGLDFTQAAFDHAPILLGPEQWLGLDGDAAGNFSHFLGFHAGQFVYMTPGGPMLRFSDDGAAYVGRVIEQIPHVPGSSSAPCEAGERAWDQAWEYRCISTNHWRRAALGDF